MAGKALVFSGHSSLAHRITRPAGAKAGVRARAMLRIVRFVHRTPGPPVQKREQSTSQP